MVEARGAPHGRCKYKRETKYQISSTRPINQYVRQGEERLRGTLYVPCYLCSQATTHSRNKHRRRNTHYSTATAVAQQHNEQGNISMAAQHRNRPAHYTPSCTPANPTPAAPPIGSVASPSRPFASTLPLRPLSGGVARFST